MKDTTVLNILNDFNRNADWAEKNMHRCKKGSSQYTRYYTMVHTWKIAAAIITAHGLRDHNNGPRDENDICSVGSVVQPVVDNTTPHS